MGKGSVPGQREGGERSDDLARMRSSEPVIAVQDLLPGSQPGKAWDGEPGSQSQ